MKIDTESQEVRNRIIIEGVKPEIDHGRFPIKRCLGDNVIVEADIFADGHDVLSTVFLYRNEDDPDWIEAATEFLGNDRWRASFVVTRLGRYQYSFMAWIDRFRTWQQALEKKAGADQTAPVDFLEGAGLIQEALRNAAGRDAETMQGWVDSLRSGELAASARIELALSEELRTLMARYAGRWSATVYPKKLTVVVEREKARFSTWYEMFPRSCSSQGGRHGTFKDCEERLPYISGMGFDVLYFPPLHPIGQTNRKGKNNNPAAGEGDPGTPWAIGSAEGGHRAVHPQLGTLEDFRGLIDKAREYGIEIALDLAFQCSPDHPYIKDHPEWFRWRPDGTIQYAENPPKKYQDIYPLDFESQNWREIWEEIKGVVLFWVEQGVRIFRVDNPHTKPFVFWEWLISGLKKDYPELIFLSEAFTRPKIMYRLAKLGFSQSYTYFTWRNAKWELTQYLTELTQTEVAEFYRPNLWPNTPDILNDYLRDGGRPAFMTRLVLAATLGANYGVYGPAFELCENRRRDTVSEEYLNSEKYEIRYWDIDSPGSLKGLITRINHARKENPALQNDTSLRFHRVDNDQLICYSKRTEDFSNVILAIVNLDYRYTQSGWVDLVLDELGLDHHRPYQMHDLLTGVTYRWQGSRNYVELDPRKLPAHVFRIQNGIDEGRNKRIMNRRGGSIW